MPALQRQLISVPLLAGLNTKDDPFQVPLSDLLELENAVFTTPGRLQKRNGFESLTLDLVSGKIDQGAALATYNQELLLFTGQEALSYSATLQKWLNKGTAVSVICKKDQLLANANSQYLGTGLLFENFEIYSYVELDAGTGLTSVRYTILDHTTKVRIIDNQVVDNAGIMPQLIAFNGLVYIFYLTSTAASTNLTYKSFDSSAPFNLSTATTLLPDVHPGHPSYDIIVDGYVRIVYNSDQSYDNIFYVAYDNLANSPIIIGSAGQGPNGVAVMTDTNKFTWVLWADGNGINAKAFDDSGAVVGPATKIQELENVNRVTACQGSQGIQVFFEINSNDLYDAGNYLVRTCNLRLSSGAIVISKLKDFKRGVGLYAKPFVINGIHYVVLQRSSDLQSTYFLVDQNENIIARFQYEEGASFVQPAYKCLCQPFVDNGVAVFPTINLGFQNILTGLSRFSIDFDSNNSFIGYDAAGTFNIVGGIVQSYDNTGFVENNFLLYIEGLTAQGVDGDGLSAGSYLYKGVYKALNNNNIPEYSKTSVAIQVQLDTAGNVILTAPTLRMTQRDQVVIEIYRTAAGQSTLYYKVGEVLNDPTVDSLSITDDMGDEELISQLPLYTTGGILENIAPPNCNLMAVYNNRVFVAGLEITNQMAYSKLLQSGFALEFAEENVIDCTPIDGPITGLAVLENALIIFKDNSIYSLSGQGPNNYGQLDDFSDVQIIPSDVGCISANSIQRTEQGLIFQSKKGIYLLSRSLEVTYIGKSVEKYNALTVTSSKLVESKNELRFTSSGLINGRPYNVILVYDTLESKWTTFTGLGDITDSEVWDSNYIVLTNKGIVKQEMPGIYKDDGKYITMKIGTSWIKMNDLEGYGLTYNVYFLGNNFDRHTLVANVAYDYEPFDSYHKEIDSNDLRRGGTNYGDGNYGDNVYGGRYYGYEGRLQLKKIKCRSIKITFQDQANGDNSGQGYALSGFVFEIGVEQGGYRFRKNNSFGSTQ